LTETSTPQMIRRITSHWMESMMHRTTVLQILILFLLSPGTVIASPQSGSVILIDGIVFTVELPGEVPAYAAVEGEGLHVFVEGQGTLNLDGIEALRDHELNGQTVIFQQGFLFDISGFPDFLEALSVSTAGKLDLPGDLPDLFFSGNGTCTAGEGGRNCTLDLDALVNGGGSILFNIANINIDHTSAGFMLSDFAGTARMIVCSRPGWSI
jgi:hypothetical protein